jgi:GT2 family glycosyltransferase
VTVAAVVVRWRGGDEVDRCLRSLLAQSGPDLGRIVLVDSGSGDGGAQRLAASYPEVEVIALAENRSFAHAANTGAAAITEDLIFLLNPDTEVEMGAVTTLVDALEQRPQTAGVVPLLVNADGSAQHLWQLRQLPTVARLATGRSGAAAFSSPPTAPAGVIQPAAAAWLIRRDVWRALGGFDESFAPAWWEDVDFCARLADRLGSADHPADEGFVVIPQARLRHQGGSSLEELDQAAFLTAFCANLLRYSAIHHTKHLSLIRTGLRWSMAVRAIVRPRQSEAYLAARREF